jgi:hypothetical protein
MSALPPGLLNITNLRIDDENAANTRSLFKALRREIDSLIAHHSDLWRTYLNYYELFDSATITPKVRVRMSDDAIDRATSATLEDYRQRFQTLLRHVRERFPIEHDADHFAGLNLVPRLIYPSALDAL